MLLLLSNINISLRFELIFKSNINFNLIKLELISLYSIIVDHLFPINQRIIRSNI